MGFRFRWWLLFCGAGHETLTGRKASYMPESRKPRAIAQVFWRSCSVLDCRVGPGVILLARRIRNLISFAPRDHEQSSDERGTCHFFLRVISAYALDTRRQTTISSADVVVETRGPAKVLKKARRFIIARFLFFFHRFALVAPLFRVHSAVIRRCMRLHKCLSF